MLWGNEFHWTAAAWLKVRAPYIFVLILGTVGVRLSPEERSCLKNVWSKKFRHVGRSVAREEIEAKSGQFVFNACLYRQPVECAK